MQLSISPAEHAARVERVRAEMAARGLDYLVSFGPQRVAYLTGFFHVPTERPIAMVLPLEGEPAVLLPALEQEHVEHAPLKCSAWVYPEYPAGPSGKHPMRHLADGLRRWNAAGKRIGCDNDGYELRWGYLGPKLSDVVPDADVVEVPDLVDRLRQVKSPAEIELIRESARWGNLAHRLMHDGVELGRTEIEIFMRASADATAAMLRTLGPGYQQRAFFTGPAFVIFKTGANTALPHGMSRGRGIQRGDVLVTGAGAEVGGYYSELERTMIVGEPTDAFGRGFEAMLAAQDAGFAAIRPGHACREVEADVSQAIRDLGWADNQRHHTGHGIGLEIHEQPFLDLGDETVLEPGMVFSVEPGLYVPGLAGFRHSDTVVVTETGNERLTYYPRDLESMTIRI